MKQCPLDVGKDSVHTTDVCLKRLWCRLSRGASSLEPLIFDVPHQLIMCFDCMHMCMILSHWITRFTVCFLLPVLGNWNVLSRGAESGHIFI